MRTFRLSYTKLDKFSCPRCYLWTYVKPDKERLKEKRAPLKGLAFENRFHTTLERFHKAAPKDGKVDEAALLATWRQTWERGKDKDFAIRTDYQDGIRLLKEYAERENREERVPAYVEEEISLAFGPYYAFGRIDRLDFTPGNRYDLTDYKLNHQLPRKNSAEGNRQLAFHAV
jgi:RecB family exonuclease